MGTNLRHSDGREFKFVGEKPSAGYIPGEIYKLFFRAKDGYLYVHSSLSKQELPYTIAGFINNWRPAET